MENREEVMENNARDSESDNSLQLATIYNVKEQQEETYEKAGGAERMHGDDYHWQMVMLLLLKAWLGGLRFRLAMEYAPAGKFDDIYLSYEEQDGTWVHLYMQLKHSNKGEGKIVYQDLIKSPSSKQHKMKFDLKEYAISHKCLPVNKELGKKEKKLCMIVTNRDLDFDSAQKIVKNDESEITETVNSEKCNNLFLNRNMFSVCDLLPLTLFNSHKDKIFKLTDEYCKEWSNKIYSDQQILNANKQNNKQNKKQESPPPPTLSMDDIRVYLKELVFVVGQPGVEEVEALVKEELLSQCFNDKDMSEYLYACMLTWVQKEMKSKEGHFIVNADVEKMFSKIKINTVHIKPIISFCMREEKLKEVKNILECEKCKDNNINILISGTAGVGKTQLALKIAQQSKEDLKFNHILWIDSETEKSLETAFRDLYSRLGYENEKDKPTSLTYVIEKVYTKFSSKGKSLFIFDNVEMDLSSGKNNFMPAESIDTKNMYFIMTSQKLFDHCNYFLIPLDCFTIEESVDFLEQNIQFKVRKPEELLRVAEMLGCLPLALQLAVAYIKQQTKLPNGNNYSISKFINKFETNLPKFVKKIPKDKGINYKNSIQVMWNMAIESVKSHKYGILSIKILHMLAFTGPDSIPISMFQHLPDKEGDKSGKALLLLKNHSLINYENNFGSIHRLLQEVNRHNCDTKLVIDDLLKLIKLDVSTEENKTKFPTKTYVSHAMRVWSHACENECLIRDHSSFPLAIANTNFIPNETRCTFLEQHMSRHEKELGWESEELLKLQHCYTGLLYCCYQYDKTVTHCQYSHNNLKPNLKDHRLALDLIRYKGLSLHFLDRIEDAFVILYDLHKTQVQSLGLNDSDTNYTIRYMVDAASHLSRQDKPEALETCIGYLKEIFAKDDFKTLVFLDLMPGVECDLRRADKVELALELYKQVHTKLVMTSPSDDPLTQCVGLGRASLLCDMGETEEAWQLYLGVCKVRGKLTQPYKDKAKDFIVDLKYEIEKNQN